MRVLLDTCTFLWLRESPERLSEAARAVLIDGANEVSLSAVSAWEIAVKHAAGRLPLPRPIEDFIRDGRKIHHIESLAFDENCALHLGRLPDIHRDPFDWMLICQAIEHQLTILTPDPQIRKYPIKTLW